jgi:hypothetical protein
VNRCKSVSNDKQFEKTNPIHRLSFLRKQETKLTNDPGFRIKCGMTTPNKGNYAKQSQFFNQCLFELTRGCNSSFVSGISYLAREFWRLFVKTKPIYCTAENAEKKSVIYKNSSQRPLRILRLVKQSQFQAQWGFLFAKPEIATSASGGLAMT